MGGFFSVCGKNNHVLSKNKYQKYFETIQVLNKYSRRKIQTDSVGNYLFPIFPDSSLYNDRSIVRYMSSYTQNNEIKVFNYIDIDFYDIPIDKYDKSKIGIYALVISSFNSDYNFSISEFSIKTNEKNKLEYRADAYNGFIPQEDCKNIKIYIGEDLFEEFKNCKKGEYQAFKTPIFYFLINYTKDYGTLHIKIEDSEEKIINIHFVVSYFQKEMLKEFRKYVLEKPHKNKIFGTYLYIDSEENNIVSLKYCKNDKEFINSLFFSQIDKETINLWSPMYLTQLKTRYLQEELIQKTWHPSRYEDWCLSYDS